MSSFVAFFELEILVIVCVLGNYCFSWFVIILQSLCCLLQSNLSQLLFFSAMTEVKDNSLRVIIVLLYGKNYSY